MNEVVSDYGMIIIQIFALHPANKMVGHFQCLLHFTALIITTMYVLGKWEGGDGSSQIFQIPT